MIGSVLGHSIWSRPELDEGTLEGTLVSFLAGEGYSFDRVLIWMGIVPTINT